VAEGEGLAQLLGATKAGLPWNAAWSGKAVSTPAAGGGVELSGKGLPKITLLSPTPERLQELYEVWAKELDRLRRRVCDETEVEPALRGSAPTIEELADRTTATDSATANGSSIAFLLEHRGASLLLGADAFPTVLVPAIQALASRRGLPGPIEVDAFKLSHHGSRANVTADLLGAVRAKHYVVSTNNSYFNHPNDEAMARVITLGRQPTIWFNYNTPKNRKWGDEELTKRYGHCVQYPAREGTGVRLELPARTRASRS
jgi:hypothetical protein